MPDDDAAGTDWVTDEARLLAETLQVQSQVLAALREIRVILQGLADRAPGT